jgi:hypothetical protein
MPKLEPRQIQTVVSMCSTGRSQRTMQKLLPSHPNTEDSWSCPYSYLVLPLVCKRRPSHGFPFSAVRCTLSVHTSVTQLSGQNAFKGGVR